MYDWFVSCQMRTVLNFKKDDVALSVPTSAIVAPGLAVWCWCECIRSGVSGLEATRFDRSRKAAGSSFTVVLSFVVVADRTHVRF